jgi:ADP-ribosylglycohydrolase
MITHNDAAAISSAIAVVALLSDLLCMDSTPDAAWWVHRYVEVADQIEPAGHYRPQSDLGFAGRLTDFVAEAVPTALVHD